MAEENEDFSIHGSPFPDENVHPSKKESPKYIAQYGKAIFYTSNRYGHGGNWNDDEQFDTLMDVAQGNLSVDNIRRLFGFYNDNKAADNDGSASLAFIDPKILNLATKYVNRAVAKMTRYYYDLQLEAIDPVSVRKKEEYQAKVKAFYEFKGHFAKMGVDPKEIITDLDIDVLPQYPDDLFFEMLTTEKVREAIQAELGLQLIHEMNDFQQTRRMVDRYLVCIGRGHVHCYRDGNGLPREEMINPKYYVGSFTQREDYKGQEYAGFYDFPTVAQFRKEAKGWMTDEAIEEVISKYANQNQYPSNLHPGYDAENYDGLDYIPVLRFYFLSHDTRHIITRRNEAGNLYPTERSEKQVSRMKKGVDYDDYHKMEYTSVYGGTLVLDTDYVYKYGLKYTGRSNLVDAQLPIISHAPNMYEGKVVSFLAQMIEPLYMINVAWNKIKEILAKEWMGIMEFDLTEIEDIALGSGGKKWTPRQVLKHFAKTRQLIKRGAVNRHDQKYSGGAVSIQQSGVQLADYFNTLQTSILMLEAMVGTAAAESSQTPDRLAVRVAQMSQNVGDLDMEYLYNADESLYRRVSHQMLLLLQEAKRDGVGIEGFISALGQHFAVPEDISYCDFGMFLKRAPGPEEWAEFYEDLRIGLEKGTITHLDSAYIREIKNLKKARMVLGHRIKINERKAAETAQMNNQMAMQANSQAAQDKGRIEAEKEILKDRLARERMEIQAQIDDYLVDKKARLDAQMMRDSDRTKKDIAKQKSIDEIIKEAGRSQAQKEIERMKAAVKAEQKDKSPAK
jgi:hypothetical protein